MSLMLQNLVHKMEVGGGAKWLRIAAGALLAVLIIVGYNLRSYKNFSAPEAMDQAQLARNLAEGRGYTTKYVRPFSMFLLKRHNREHLESLTPEQKADLCRVKTDHPDISNPPLYPLVLAGLMKAGLLPETADTSVSRRFWFNGETFQRYGPDFAISLFNQVLLLLVVVALFFLARRLFDVHVASLAAVLLLAMEPLWHFCVSGLSTLLLLLLFMALVWALTSYEARANQPETGAGRVLVTAAGIGALLGAGMLTRYAYGFMLVPVLIYLVAFGGRWRALAAAVATLTFAVVVTPWVLRNINLCGAPFGTAGYAPIEASAFFAGDQLQRMLEPNLSQISLMPIWWKLFGNLRGILLNDLPAIGGGFIFAFFLVGLMVAFRSTSLSRLRWFVLFTLPVLMVVQAVGRTGLADESPGYNSENLLILLVPLVLMYGVGFFHILLDQVRLPLQGMRYLIMAVFGLVVSLPMAFTFLPPRTSPLAFPPYYPPGIQMISSWMREDELTMSDVPWAVAWYGNRQAVLLTTDVTDQFFALNDYIKPVSALYLTPRTLDAKFLTQWVRGGSEFSWGALIMGSLARGEVPAKFPLAKSYRLPEQLFLTNWERWSKTEPSDKKP